jgi:hypothetical protein
MAYEATAKKLEEVEKNLPRGLFWWRTLTQAKVAREGLFVPPCALLNGYFGPFSVELLADGDVYVGFKGEVEAIPGRIDMSKSPKEIASDLRNAISAHWKDQRGRKD